MYLFYFDEVKFEAGVQDSYWLGCVVAKAESLPKFTASMNNLAEEVFAGAASRFSGRN